MLESSEEGRFPLAPADIVAAYDKQKKILDDEKRVLNKFLNQREQLFDIFALRTSAYVMASWNILGPEKKSAVEVMAASNLDKTVLEGWVRFLEPARERKYEYLSEWVSLLQDPNGKVKAEQFAAKFQNQVLAVRKDEGELREKNAKIKAQEKEGAISKAIALDREKFYLLADLRAKARTEPRKKDAGPFYFSDDQLGSYMTSVWKEHFDTLRTNIDRLTKALPAEYPAYTVLKDKAKPENLHVYIRGNQDDLGEEAPRQFLAILSPREQVPFKQGSGRLELAQSDRYAAEPVNGACHGEPHLDASLRRRHCSYRKQFRKNSANRPLIRSFLTIWPAALFKMVGRSRKCIRRSCFRASTP